MKTALLSIQKFIFAKQKSAQTPEPIDNEVTAVDIDQVENFVNFLNSNAADYETTSDSTPGYFVFSTAPFNTEDGEAKVIVDRTPALTNSGLDTSTSDNPINQPIRHLPIVEQNANLELGIRRIADDLHQRRKDPTATPELVIAIHGFSTEQTNVRRWYKRIYRYVNQEATLKHRKNLVFVGYRWSSEGVPKGPELFKSLINGLTALPILPRGMAAAGVIGIFLCAILIFKAINPAIDLLIAVALTLASFVVAIIFSLVILRVIVYFRDTFRASNFGVPDLVEFIRLLDAELQSRAESESIPEDGLERIYLNFIGHSMGGFVVTNVIRILSDVFDPDAVRKEPSSKIGQVFSLGRLVLASPDIPVLAIAASRANFLASALRRFDEAHLFSNEGDLALRLASTTANYFSYPAKSRESGYRLGNATITPGEFGIINLKNLRRYCNPDGKHLYGAVNQNGAVRKPQKDTALHFLFTTNLGGGSPGSLADVAQERDLNANVDDFTIADLFTYFDCTDYIETGYIGTSSSVETGNNTNFDQFIKEYKKYKKFVVKPTRNSEYKVVGILSRALGIIGPRARQRTLSFFDYARLLRDFIAGRDVHGGYFDAPFSKELIYQLAFVGFKQLLELRDPNSPDAAIDQFNQKCQRYGLQVLLSPLRYSVDVQGHNLQAAKKELIGRIEGISPVIPLAEDSIAAEPPSH